jgi:hypothetical protein
MSLISFHRLLIAVAIMFCGGYAIWEVLRFLSDGSIGSALLAAAFGAAAIALAYYLRHLGRILRLGNEGVSRAKPGR